MHLTILAAYAAANELRYDIATGATPVLRREEMLEQLAAGELDCVIGTTVFDEGIDVPEIGALTLAAAGKSEIKFFQRIGRGLRRKTDGSILWVFCPYDVQHRVLQRHSRMTLKMVKKDGFVPVKVGPRSLRKQLSRVVIPEVEHVEAEDETQALSRRKKKRA